MNMSIIFSTNQSCFSKKKSQKMVKNVSLKSLIVSNTDSDMARNVVGNKTKWYLYICN